MAVKRGRTYELAIDKVAFGGKGLAHVDGMAVFVAQAVPGDVVRVKIVKKKRNYAIGRVVELLIPSTDRIDPPCPYSGICGGCTWQFLNYDKQLAYKRQHVVEALAHPVRIEAQIPVHPVLPAEPTFGYRNKMEFSCSDHRWRMPHEMEQTSPEAEFGIGLHVPGTFYKVLDISACLLQPPTGNVILEDVRTYIGQSGAPVYGLRSHEGFWRFLMLRHSVAHNQWLVNIITSKPDKAELLPLAEKLVERHPDVVSVVNNVNSRRAGIAVGESEYRLLGRQRLLDHIGPYQFEISANSFFQTNSRGAAILYDTVRHYADLSGRENLVDLYCGTGTIAIYLSDAVSQAVGFEINPGAVADARRNADRNGIRNCRFVQGDINVSLAGLSDAPHIFVIDPPRAGMHPSVIQQILTIKPKRIVYVSCNPATMARDLVLLAQAYRVMEIQPVDMFPHTYHIEAVVKLESRCG